MLGRLCKGGKLSISEWLRPLVAMGILPPAALQLRTYRTLKYICHSLAELSTPGISERICNILVVKRFPWTAQSCPACCQMWWSLAPSAAMEGKQKSNNCLRVSETICLHQFQGFVQAPQNHYRWIFPFLLQEFVCVCSVHDMKEVLIVASQHL